MLRDVWWRQARSKPAAEGKSWGSTAAHKSLDRKQKLRGQRIRPSRAADNGSGVVGVSMMKDLNSTDYDHIMKSFGRGKCVRIIFKIYVL